MAKGQSGSGNARVQLDLLGGFTARDGAGREIAIASRKAQALLAYLALSVGKPQPREKLTALLWSDRGEAQARSSLRQALSELRKALPGRDPPLLMAQRDRVWLDPEGVRVDAVKLERLVDSEEPEDLAEAAELYQGDFLDGLDVRDTAFEEWRRGERDQLRERTSQALLRLLDQQTGDQAIATARRLLELDPLSEATHRTLMRLYADRGEKALAVKQYRACCEVLAAELGIKPEVETEALAEEIRIGAQGSGHAVDSEQRRPPRRREPLPLPDKPSIAVLPFTNMSDDFEQEYFADGITEDITTALSRISGLLVVSRRSTKIYKGKTVDVGQVGQEQGVRHVLEGSVRKGENRIRITAQLIDAKTGNHKWAEHYDRELGNIFEVQDDITKQVTTELNVQLARGEEARVWARETSNIQAWEKLMRAMPLTDGHVREQNAEARRLAGEAIELDPTYGAAWVALGWTHYEDALWGWAESRQSSMQNALSCAQEALKCESENAQALGLLGTILMSRKNAEKAIATVSKVVALSPNHADNVALAGMVMIFSGRPNKGLPLMKRAMRLSPVYPQWYYMMVGVVHHILGDQEKAIEIFRDCVAKESETALHRVWLASALVQNKQIEEAQKLAAEILEIDPDFSTSGWVKSFSADKGLTNLLLTGLDKAGLPG